MIATMRGVNKLIVEIKDTENEYFDRAILFVKPGMATAEQSELDKSARKLLSAVKDGKPKANGKRLWTALGIGLAVLGAAAVTVMILFI